MFSVIFIQESFERLCYGTDTHCWENRSEHKKIWRSREKRCKFGPVTELRLFVMFYFNVDLGFSGY